MLFYFAQQFVATHTAHVDVRDDHTHIINAGQLLQSFFTAAGEQYIVIRQLQGIAQRLAQIVIVFNHQHFDGVSKSLLLCGQCHGEFSD